MAQVERALRSHWVAMGEPAGVIPPLSIGEIMDRSVTLAITRWRVLLVLVLILKPTGLWGTRET